MGATPPPRDVLHALSLVLLNLRSCLDSLIYYFLVPRFLQDCWELSCRPTLGARLMGTPWHLPREAPGLPVCCTPLAPA